MGNIVRHGTALRAVAASWRIRALVLITLLQAVSVFFFVGDVVMDYRALGLDRHTAYEACATVALLLGVGFGAAEMYRVLRRAANAECSIRIAANAFGDMITERFGSWGLSPSEREVALLTLKGFDAPEIADIRRTARGTVRAQLAGIYAKSGKANRGQFVSSFIDALLETPIIEPHRVANNAGQGPSPRRRSRSA